MQLIQRLFLTYEILRFIFYSAVRQEFGDLEKPTIIGMTGNTPPGVTITQRFGNVNGGTIIGYDGSTN